MSTNSVAVKRQVQASIYIYIESKGNPMRIRLGFQHKGGASAMGASRVEVLVLVLVALVVALFSINSAMALQLL